MQTAGGGLGAGAQGAYGSGTAAREVTDKAAVEAAAGEAVTALEGGAEAGSALSNGIDSTYCVQLCGR